MKQQKKPNKKGCNAFSNDPDSEWTRIDHLTKKNVKDMKKRQKVVN